MVGAVRAGWRGPQFYTQTQPPSSTVAGTARGGGEGAAAVARCGLTSCAVSDNT